MKISQKRKIILASRSPARRALLKEAGLKICVFYSDVDESRRRGEPVGRYALRLAKAKATVCARSLLKKGAVVIGVDTVIAFENKIYGKPATELKAKAYLKALSGNWHQVYTAFVILDSTNNKLIKKLMVTRVKFNKLTDEMIKWYISTGEPLKAAGAYSIQGKGGALVESVKGCFTNVIGISVPETLKILKSLKAI